MTDIETSPWKGMSPEDAYRKGYSDGTRLEPVSVCVRCIGRGEAEARAGLTVTLEEVRDSMKATSTERRRCVEIARAHYCWRCSVPRDEYRQKEERCGFVIAAEIEKENT